MPMKKEDQELFLRYLNEGIVAKLPVTRRHICPVCGSDEWQASGLYHLMEFNENTLKPMQPSTRKILPLAVMTCPNCEYVELFAWLPIQEWGKTHA